MGNIDPEMYLAMGIKKINNITPIFLPIYNNESTGKLDVKQYKAWIKNWHFIEKKSPQPTDQLIIQNPKTYWK